ncbi:hypothetical protein, partial [Streptomyces vietnamensis]|uniref:hypothetical protein n=1 Tax=Streptomyces vietnamensis TaxID=362257 RepID=UPI003444FC6C
DAVGMALHVEEAQLLAVGPGERRAGTEDGERICGIKERNESLLSLFFGFSDSIYLLLVNKSSIKNEN